MKSLFISLISGNSEISSKRFAGLSLIGSYMIYMILGAIGGNITEEFEGLMKVTLYTGSVLLGSGLAEPLFKNVNRPIIKEIEKEDESD